MWTHAQTQAITPTQTPAKQLSQWSVHFYHHRAVICATHFQDDADIIKEITLLILLKAHLFGLESVHMPSDVPYNAAQTYSKSLRAAGIFAVCNGFSIVGHITILSCHVTIHLCCPVSLTMRAGRTAAYQSEQICSPLIWCGVNNVLLNGPGVSRAAEEVIKDFTLYCLLLH